MSDNEDVPDYKTKRLQTLARAREIARQNRLAKSSDKKEIHNTNIAERKNARVLANKQVKEKQETLVKEEEVEEEEEEKEEVVKTKPKPKPKKKKQIIVEESESSSESETEEIVIVKKKKKKPQPPTRIVYKEPKPKQQQSIESIQRNFSSYFTL